MRKTWKWTLTDISLQIHVPKIPGQDTSQFQEWHWKDVNKHKAIHIKCNVDDVSRVQTLLEAAKYKMVEALWGRNVRVSKVVPTQGRRRRDQAIEEVSAYTLNANKTFAMRHICYHASMVPKGIVGILDVNKILDIMFVSNPQEKVGEVNLRDVLYKLRLSDDSSLVGEVHQAAAMSPVDVVVGNTEEAGKMIEMMNKNVAAFLYNAMRG